MNHLMRSLAPIPSDAWEKIEEEASETLKEYLAGRKLVDFTGPLGWQAYAVDLGVTRKLAKAPEDGVHAR